ncbi:MAG: AmmeMemoRadiSam system protein A [Tissierellia bacterium]|nr:AmmeMemoRadiSam system protein A [Tissierellia bacterium]
MGAILSGYLFPHPPIIVKEIGRGEEVKAQKTIEGSKALALDIKNKQPSTIIVITSHGPLFRDAISISVEGKLEGDFSNFGNRSLKFEFNNNLDLVNRIIHKASVEGIPVAKIDEDFAKDYNISLKLDHGTLVPLYFVTEEYKDFSLVHITYGLLPPKKLYEFGKIVKEAVLESEEDAVIIASGDMSHRLSKDGPYAYSPYGEVFDRKIVELIEEDRLKDIVDFDLDLSEKAGECGLRSLMVLAGSLAGYKVKSKVLSYEGPFGVGYCNARFQVLEEDEYVKLARESLEHYVRYNRKMEVPEDLNEELLSTKAGAFVTIKKHGILRGCIGTIEATKKNLAEEIIENAISAGTRDPRFSPVTEEELSSLEYSVDVLKRPEPVSSMEELDPKKYGVIVSKGFRKGLLLPNIEGVDSPEEQVEIALKKAGIMKFEKYKLERFEVERHI